MGAFDIRGLGGVMLGAGDYKDVESLSVKHQLSGCRVYGLEGLAWITAICFLEVQSVFLDEHSLNS